MVVKSATKKKLMDLGIAENFAHMLADDRKWDDVKEMTQNRTGVSRKASDRLPPCSAAMSK